MKSICVSCGFVFLVIAISNSLVLGQQSAVGDYVDVSVLKEYVDKNTAEIHKIKTRLSLPESEAPLVASCGNGRCSLRNNVANSVYSATTLNPGDAVGFGISVSSTLPLLPWIPILNSVPITASNFAHVQSVEIRDYQTVLPLSDSVDRRLRRKSNRRLFRFVNRRKHCN